MNTKHEKNSTEKIPPNDKILAVTEILYDMLLYSKVSTDLTYIEIATTSLERITLFAVECNNATKPSNNNRFLQNKC